MDLDPYVCSNWWVRDYPNPFPKKRWFPNETRDQQFTYKATHSLHLRSENPLPPVRPSVQTVFYFIKMSLISGDFY